MKIPKSKRQVERELSILLDAVGSLVEKEEVSTLEKEEVKSHALAKQLKGLKKPEFLALPDEEKWELIFKILKRVLGNKE